MNSRLNWRTQRNGSHSSTFDHCQTPQHALDPLLPYLRPGWTVWESACGEGNLVKGLTKAGLEVIATDILSGDDFFTFEPAQWHCQVTNPPYSIKPQWIERSYSLNKPFALLLPVEVLGVGGIQKLFKRFGVEILLLNRRVGFKTVNTDFSKSNAWFPTAWMTWGLNIGSQLTFATIVKRSDEQLTMFREAA